MTNPRTKIDTPPNSTLSTPSPTELQDSDPLAAETSRDMLSRSISSKPIYLIVATTKCTHQGQIKLGIGLKGGLPWPMVKADMAYFRKVTTDGKSSPSFGANSVIMGRKTFESIPAKFRPLAGRTNIIISRKASPDLAEEIVEELKQSVDKDSAFSASINSLNNNTAKITAKRKNTNLSDIVVTSTVDAAVKIEGCQTYCIGGSEIYNLFLNDQSLRPRLRILQTVIEKLQDGEEFECDTFWPEPLDEQFSDWREVKKEELISWTGIDVPQGEDDWTVDDKVGVRIRMIGWESSQT